MLDGLEAIIAELGGIVLGPYDARRPKRLRPGDLLALVPTASRQFSHLVIHITDILPFGTPDVYIPGDQTVGLRPHVNGGGLVCSRAYHVYANPGRLREVLRQAIQDAVDVLDRTLTDEERDAHFLAETQAYWVTDDATKFHFLPSLLSDTFVFQVAEGKSGQQDRVTVLEAVHLGHYPNFFGFRIDVPVSKVTQFLQAPEQWFRQDPEAQKIVLRGLVALTRHNPRPQAPDLAIAFRIRSPLGDIILAARAVQKLKLGRFKTANYDAWLSLFHQQIRDLTKIASEDMSFRRIIRRAIGLTATQDASFRAVEEARPAVIGCGSLGSHIIELMIQGGVRTMYLVDNDLLLPENLGRHTLSGAGLYFGKVHGLIAKAQASFPDFRAESRVSDIRLPEEQRMLIDWAPSLALCAAADQNVEMLLSNLVRAGILPGTWFCWVEPHLAAGHLVYQPRGSDRGLSDLYDDTGTDWFYRHRVAADDSMPDERETGCQTAFTPFSGADAALFSALCARTILKSIASPPASLAAYRWVPDAGGLETML